LPGLYYWCGRTSSENGFFRRLDHFSADPGLFFKGGILDQRDEKLFQFPFQDVLVGLDRKRPESKGKVTVLLK
jgi:hypothetical protein